jgi:hypothetical protein
MTRNFAKLLQLLKSRLLLLNTRFQRLSRALLLTKFVLARFKGCDYYSRTPQVVSLTLF